MSEKCVLHPEKDACEIVIVQVDGERWRVPLCDECYFERTKFLALRQEIRSNLMNKMEAIRLLLLGQMKLPLKDKVSGEEI